jgi:hypothetical protein
VNHGDWFRNTSWDPEIENAFFKKLARARDKCQYLRVQASTLSSRSPDVALRLLDQYFSLGEHFDIAQAYVDRATAFLRLNHWTPLLSPMRRHLLARRAIQICKPKRISNCRF